MRYEEARLGVSLIYGGFVSIAAVLRSPLIVSLLLSPSTSIIVSNLIKSRPPVDLGTTVD